MRWVGGRLLQGLEPRSIANSIVNRAMAGLERFSTYIAFLPFLFLLLLLLLLLRSQRSHSRPLSFTRVVYCHLTTYRHPTRQHTRTHACTHIGR
jgi:hypothetical protein